MFLSFSRVNLQSANLMDWLDKHYEETSSQIVQQQLMNAWYLFSRKVVFYCTISKKNSHAVPLGMDKINIRIQLNSYNV